MLAYPIKPDLTPGDPVELIDGAPVSATEMTLSVPPAVPEGVGVYYDRATRQWIVSAEPLVEEPADYGTIVTVLAFRQRFSLAERQAIEMGALDDPAGTVEERARAAALRVHQADLAAAAFVDLGAVETRAGVQQMEAFGLLAAGRAAEILDTPVQTHELP
ncbi:hypothetical protein SAMN04244547_01601 [Azotobacter vinelandii]|nr:hypothetical protein SAMN04244547_01601 [Azotobacter vinelandii]